MKERLKEKLYTVYAYRLVEGFIRNNGGISFDFFEE